MDPQIAAAISFGAILFLFALALVSFAISDDGFRFLMGDEAADAQMRRERDRR